MFAYRAIEDAARAVSGRTGDLRPADYNALALQIGQAPAQFDSRKRPLSEARSAAAHGDETDPKLAAAKANREALVDVGRQIVAVALANEPGSPLKLTHLVP